MEVFDIYDKHRKLTGRTMVRGSQFQQGDYHLVVHICIFNSKNQLLIQQRQPWKKGWPNLWDLSVGGSALAGETSQEAAARETFEELGYRLDLVDERPFFTINFEFGFDDYYLLERDIALTDLSLQHEEVQAVKWASKDEVMQLYRDGKFIDYWFLEYLFEMRKLRGAYKSPLIIDCG